MVVVSFQAFLHALSPMRIMMLNYVHLEIGRFPAFTKFTGNLTLMSIGERFLPFCTLLELLTCVFWCSVWYDLRKKKTFFHSVYSMDSPSYGISNVAWGGTCCYSLLCFVYFQSASYLFELYNVGNCLKPESFPILCTYSYYVLTFMSLLRENFLSFYTLISLLPCELSDI